MYSSLLYSQTHYNQCPVAQDTSIDTMNWRREGERGEGERERGREGGGERGGERREGVEGVCV